jgi:hypothetical protein
MNKKSTWRKVVDAINEYENGDFIRRQELLKKIGPCNDYTVDFYRLGLTHIGVLKHISKATYQKNCSIPLTFTSSKMQALESEMKWKRSWKDWFINLEDRMR